MVLTNASCFFFFPRSSLQLDPSQVDIAISVARLIVDTLESKEEFPLASKLLTSCVHFSMVF
jgi:hypothetical protein